MKSFSWNWVGLQDIQSEKSTLWAGSKGSFTPCHKDAYGCNLHAQIIGKKEWLLWPPDADLSPTRIPYEESSIFSGVDVLEEQFQNKAIRIVLEPGDVLFVPKHWWHLVRNVETSVSINTWVDLPSDSVDRVKEAITRLLVCSVKKSDDESCEWVNPGEELSSDSENQQLLRQSISVCSENKFDLELSTKSSIIDDRCYYQLERKGLSVIENKVEVGNMDKNVPPKDSTSKIIQDSENFMDTLLNAIVADDKTLDGIVTKLICR